MRTPLAVSLLDRSRTRAGADDADAVRATVERARRAEATGFDRFWVAEHHAVPGVVGPSPAVLLAAVAAATTSIRVGSGGVMLPNHVPFVVAEQFAVLGALHPGRIDLGVGRSLGFTAPVRRALGREAQGPDAFEAQLAELLDHLHGRGEVRVRPAVGAPPVFVLATRSGLLTAARRGLPVVVGGPALQSAGPLEDYRRAFRPDPGVAGPDGPRVTVAVDVLVADTGEQARELLLPQAWSLAVARSRGEFPPLPAGADLATLTARERRTAEESLASTVHGTAAHVLDELEDLVRRTGAAELLVATTVHDADRQATADATLLELVTGPLAARLRTGS
ncbi:MsnO8 family LLM class oxidoreductase [Kineococcus rubinsiae]|uniref:MsnO8 family LLM class oxidoreductase n=1 Tax=Kineococcus rubinsiae TaxID=2609562 RepID=UPI00142F7BD1|nr:MsnO8 family LLM class oxidoreductase [Kineococcus rubinsiae]NIZ89425.1 MsnO8 family LLM class oxidoreductase [Kineococcus rubinsiae]